MYLLGKNCCADNLVLRVFFCLFVFKAAPKAYGSSPAKGHIGAVAASLHHSHSNAGYECPLCPTPQFRATADP